MQPADLDEIAAIEQEALSPWSRVELGLELQRSNDLQFAAVDDRDGKVLGWCCGRQVGSEAELLKISVLQANRRCGVASALFAHLLRELIDAGGVVLFLEVRAGNEPALQFYQKNGFRQTGLRKNYYTDPEGDALTFAKDLL